MKKESDFICCSGNPKLLQNLSNEKYNDKEAILILKKIAHPLRLKILRILVHQSEICSCDLTRLFDESQPEVSRQLGILDESGILVKRVLTMKGVSGRWHAYSIKAVIKALISHLIQPFTPEGI